MTSKKAADGRLQTRALTCLNPKLDKNLFAYATAAAAAGVGLLAQPAAAKIVYTPANLTIPENNGALAVDINGDGIADFAFYGFFFNGIKVHPEGTFASGLIVSGYQAANEVWTVESKGANCVAVLPKGVPVGTGRPFIRNAAMFSAAGNYTNGGSAHCKWGSAHHGAFVGLKFLIQGETHYGWAHVTVSATGNVVNGYAYETVANKAILTGAANGPVEHATIENFLPLDSSQPATLGMLAQGERGLSIWRKPEEQESSQ